LFKKAYELGVLTGKSTHVFIEDSDSGVLWSYSPYQNKFYPDYSKLLPNTRARPEDFGGHTIHDASEEETIPVEQPNDYGTTYSSETPSFLLAENGSGYELGNTFYNDVMPSNCGISGKPGDFFQFGNIDQLDCFINLRDSDTNEIIPGNWAEETLFQFPLYQLADWQVSDSLEDSVSGVEESETATGTGV
jgi:hypothetical protein